MAEQRDYGKYKIGGIVRDQALIFKAEAPLDDRSVVVEKGGLLALASFGDTNNGVTWMYKGMLTVVLNTGEVYVLVLKPTRLLTSTELNALYDNGTIDNEIAKYWTKLASNKDLQDIKNVVSGIFQFKGVASAIDPDHTTLTIGDATVSGSIGVAPNIKLFENKLLISYGTVLQENLDSVKYAWGTSEYPNLFFTDKLYTTKDDEGQALYERGAEKDLQYINVFDTLYFYKREESVNYTIPSLGAGGSPTTGTRNYTVWEALDNGGTLYSLPNGNTLDIYTVTSSSSTLPDKLVTGITSTPYKYYEFTPLTTKYVVNINSLMESITASPENNGHVYQIGEEEYASNGHMWVQLGSPKTDWIVL